MALSQPLSDHQALFDTGGSRITSRDVRNSMRINIVAGCLGISWYTMTAAMPLTMFMQAIGASGFLIGAITTVRLVAMGVQVPASLLAENIGSRKRFWAPMVMSQRATWFLVACTPLLWTPGSLSIPVAVILLVALSEIMGNAGTASWLSWMTDLVPAKTSGRFWGVRQSILTTASLVALAFVGHLLDHYRNPVTGHTSMTGFAIVFGVAALLGVSDITIHLWVKEPRPAQAERATPIFERLLAPLKNSDFRMLTLAFGACNFGFALIGTFGIVYLKRDFHVTYSELAALTIAASIGTIGAGLLVGYLVDRLGARSLCLILFIAAPVTGASWFFIDHSVWEFRVPVLGVLTAPQAICVQCLANFLLGGIGGGIAICQLRLASVFTSPKGRTLALAVHWSLVGLVAAAGPLLGGIIMDRFTSSNAGFHGLPFSFFQVLVLLFMASFWFGAVPLLLGVRRPIAEATLGATASRIFLINPFLAMRNFYIVQTMAGHSSSHERARALHTLGMSRSALAVPDLVQRLDDPSLEVREEAIEALGAIGTGEAVEALIARLDDPAYDPIPDVCKALRRAPDSRAVEPLLRRLSSTDRETLGEAARALGAIGDRRAIPPLLDLIRDTRDNKVIAASSEALASLGELSAAYQIIPQMRAISTPTLKRALSVATGDLLGEKEDFYRLLIAETEAPGSEAGEVLRQLSRRVRKRFPAATPQLHTIEQIETAYNDAQVGRCAEMLLHLGLHLVQFVHRLPVVLDPHEVMQGLLERDRRAAIGIWYLKILNEPWEIGGADSREPADILLGLHIVSSIMARETQTKA